MMYRAMILSGLACLLAACSASSGSQPLVNSGSYNWTDQVRDARGYPLQGWGNVVSPDGGPSQ